MERISYYPTIASYSLVISTLPQPIAGRPLVDVINARKAIARFTRGGNLSFDYCALRIPLSSKRDSFLKWLGGYLALKLFLFAKKDKMLMDIIH
jgi:hypothetical protein